MTNAPPPGPTTPTGAHPSAGGGGSCAQAKAEARNVAEKGKQGPRAAAGNDIAADDDALANGDTRPARSGADAMSEQRYPIEQPEKSLGDLVSELTSEFSELVNTHVALAKAELKQDARQAGRAGGMVGGAGVAALVAVLMLSAAAAWDLAEVMAPGWAFLIVGAVWAIVAGVLALTGKKKLDEMDPGPRQTMDEIEEDKQWLKTQTG
jgi:uncharacterized membrane protein YqjE